MATEYRNSIRSRKSIRQAFSELVNEKGGIKKITVKEIVERADISKSTFYCHYDDIDGLIHEMEDEILSAIQTKLDAFVANPSKSAEPIMLDIKELIKANEANYKLLLTGFYPTDFLFRIKALCIETLRNTPAFETKNTDPELRYAEIAYFTCAYIDLIVGCLQGYGNMTIDQVYDFTAELHRRYVFCDENK